MPCARTRAPRSPRRWRPRSARPIATSTDPGPYKTDGEAIGRRALRNVCLGYLAAGNPERRRAARQGAIRRAAEHDRRAGGAGGADRHRLHRAQGGARRISTSAGRTIRWSSTNGSRCRRARRCRERSPRCAALTRHSAFTRSNPNRLRALVGTFSQANQLHFHDASGAGYRFLADEVLTLDPDNPQVAARMVQALGQWRRFDPARQALMKAQLQRIHDSPGLSTNTFEMVSKSLADALIVIPGDLPGDRAKWLAR